VIPNILINCLFLLSLKNLISIILCEATAIYGVILAIVMLGSIKTFDENLADVDEIVKSRNWLAGYVMFGSGLMVSHNVHLPSHDPQYSLLTRLGCQTSSPESQLESWGVEPL
jgi:hypothetical protein